MVAEVLLFLCRRRGQAPRGDGAGGRRRRHDLPRAARGGGRHRAVELPHRHHLVEGGAGAGHREHHRRQAGRADPADRASPGRAWPSMPASPRGCSRWWRAGARWSGPGWSSTPRWPRSPSPARPRRAGDVMARAAGTIKRVTLELGGKSATIVFADADLERAAAAHPGGVFANAGQDCCARSRLLVQAVGLRPLRGAAGRGRPRRGRSATRRTPPPDGTAGQCGPPPGRGRVPRPGDGRPGRRCGGGADHRPRARRPGLLVPADRGRPGRCRNGGWPARRSSGPWWR